MENDKEQLRSFYKKRRANLTEKERSEMSFKIAENARLFLSERKELRHFHIFFPIKSQFEVNTFLIFDYLQAIRATVYTSKVDPASHKLQTLKVLDKTTFQLDKWGIPLPSQFAIAQNEFLEVIFIPLLAYDRQGNRVGFGKGYYDYFLQDLDPNVLKIGLSYFSPEFKIQAELHDIPLDFCITPEEVFSF